MSVTFFSFISRGERSSWRTSHLFARTAARNSYSQLGEQDFYAQKGFTNPPSRCPDCHAARKAQRSMGGGYGGGVGGERQMYPAVCAQCGKETEVPFQPSAATGPCIALTASRRKSLRVAATAVVAAVAPAAAATAVAATVVVAAVAPAAAATAVVAVAAAALAARIAIVAAGGHLIVVPRLLNRRNVRPGRSMTCQASFISIVAGRVLHLPSSPAPGRPQKGSPLPARPSALAGLRPSQGPPVRDPVMP